MQFTAFVLNCGCFGPLLLFGVKVPFKYAGIAFALSQSIPGIVLTSLIFSKKFKTITSWSNLIKKPIYDTYIGLKIGTPYILNVIMGLFPLLVAINLMSTAAVSQGVIAQYGPCLSVFFKIQPLANCFSIAFGQGLLGPGSYAFSRKNYDRVKKLFFIALTASLIPQFIWLGVLVGAPVSVAKIWLSDKATLEYAKTMIPKPFITNWTTGVNEIVTSLLQCLGFAWTAMTPSIVRGIFYIVYGLILYYTNKHDSVRMIYTYCLNDTTILILDFIIVIKPLIELYRNHDFIDNKDDSQEESANKSETKEDTTTTTTPTDATTPSNDSDKPLEEL